MTRSRKVGLITMIMDEEDKTIIAWVMGMQACGLSIMF
jgi:succinate dehydrogenase flavin-adding protein (antitoxin of CptAB toxin-antitoxin module)